MTDAIKAMNTILRYADGANEVVGSLTKIGTPKRTADAIDVTNMDNTDGYAEFIQGLRDGGTFSVEGQMVKGDAGQVAIGTHFAQDTAGGVRAMEIEFIDGSILAIDTVCTGFQPAGDADVRGMVPFSADFKVTGAPVWTPGP